MKTLTKILLILIILVSISCEKEDIFYPLEDNSIVVELDKVTTYSECKEKEKTIILGIVTTKRSTIHSISLYLGDECIYNVNNLKEKEHKLNIELPYLIENSNILVNVTNNDNEYQRFKIR
jgi:hypothetical protein